MEITYQRDATGSRMVISGERRQVGFEEEMLKTNEISVLLNFYETEYDGRIQLWYDISGKKSLRDFVEQEGVTVENLQMVFQYLSLAYRSLSEYLIGEDNIYISPDTIFLENKKSAWMLFLIYCPLDHINFFAQLREILQFYIASVDHRQKEVTALCYELFAITEQEEFSLREIIERLREEYDAGQETGHLLESQDASLSSMKYYGQQEIRDGGATPRMWDDATAYPTEWVSSGGMELADAQAVSERWEEVEHLEPIEPERKGFLRFFKIKKNEKRQSQKKEGTGKRKDRGEDVSKRRPGALLKGLMQRLSRRREELFPPEDELEDLEFDPVEEYEETGLLSVDDIRCSGKLIYESGGSREQDFQISHTPFRIGSKEKNNDAVLHSSVVSRYHAKIILQDGVYYLEDLNSRNGTFLNGMPIPYHEATPIRPMDLITFADVTYRVV